MKKIILFYFAILFYNCGAGVSDFIDDLGDGYYYYGEGKGANFVFRGKEEKDGHRIDSIIIYADATDYDYDDHFILLKQEPNIEHQSYREGSDIWFICYSFKLVDSLQTNIPDVYLELYKKHAKDSVFYRKLASKISFNNTMEDQRLCRSVADSIIKLNPYYQKIYSRKINYWIIQKKYNQLFGPYSREEYLTKKVKLGVSKYLNLES